MKVTLQRCKCVVMAAMSYFEVFTYLIICNLLNGSFSFVSLTGRDKIPIYTDFHGLTTDGSFKGICEFIFFKIHVNIYQTYCQSNFQITSAVNKSTKHGSICLVLPSKHFEVDLTICVDVSSNPGPELTTKRSIFGSNNSRSTRLPTWLAPNINSNIVYKPSYVRGFNLPHLLNTSILEYTIAFVCSEF